MILFRRLLFFFCGLLAASAQTFQPSPVGYPPFISLQNGSFDSVNLSNLNTTFSIPIVSYPGRGTRFVFKLTYNSLVMRPILGQWSPVAGANRGSNGYSSNYGWQFRLGPGILSYDQNTTPCDSRSGATTEWSSFRFTDANGTEHSFSTDYFTGNTCNGSGGITTGYANDGSGYYIDHTIVYSPNGDVIGSNSFTDSNGNQILVTNPNQNEDDWTDTSGRVVLKAIASPNWTSPSTVQYIYTDPNGSAQTITVNFGGFNIQTAYQCAASEFNSLSPVSLPTSISLPNGKQYAFSYETTPGQPSKYTGRLQQVTLPTGGSYSYTGQTQSCADGTGLTLTRTINDGVSNQAFAYSRSSVSPFTTTITAPIMPWDNGVANQTVVTFTNGLESSRTISQGATSLLSSTTSYSAQMPPFTITSKTTIGSQTSQNQTDYDASGNLTSVREYSFGTAPNPGPIARTTNISYLTGQLNNLINRPTQKLVYDSANTLKFKQVIAYDGAGITCITGALGHDDVKHGCSFLSRGNPTSTTIYANASAGTGAITKNSTYDSLGNVRTADADCCVTQSFVYSSATQYIQPDSVTSGTGPTLTRSYTYNSANLLATMTDENNQVWHYSYDALFRMTDTQRPDNAHITMAYNDASNNYVVSNPIQGTDRNIETISYDGVGRAIRNTGADAGGTVYSNVDTQYDAFNRVYKQSNPYTGSPQYWTESDFDPLSRVTKVIHPDGSTETSSYSGATTTTTDGAGKQKQLLSDSMGRTVTVNEPDVNNGNSLTVATNYGYTVLDALTIVSQGVQSRSYQYDDAGRLTGAINPESGGITLVPNNFGLVTQKTDARGVITTFSYNSLNQLAGISYNVGTTGVPATPSVTFGYGSTPAQFNNGRLISMTDGPGSETYAYDQLGRVTSLTRKVNGVNYTSGYAYNLGNELTNLTYPSGRVVAQHYDLIGRLNLVNSGDGLTTFANNFGYDTAFHLTGMQYGNGVVATYGFNPQTLQVATVGYAKQAQTYFSASYGYSQNGGNNGQITRIVDNFQAGRSLTYTYDALNRVKTAVTDGSTSFPKWGLSWTYDRYGNRSAQTVTAGSGPSNSLGINASTNTIVGNNYDANGNMLSEAGLGGAYTYDAENRMLTGVIASHPMGTYTYSGANLRTTRNVNGTLTTYIYSGNNVIAEYLNNQSGTNVGREYIYADEKLIGTSAGTDLKYYHQDHQSIRLITDGSTATQVDDRAHYPFGELWYDNGTFSTKFVFTNYKRDPDESNNDYAINRMYSNRLGRFLHTDRIGGTYTNPQSFNLFAYVTDDPVNMVDPTGLESLEGGGGVYCLGSRCTWDSSWHDGEEHILPTASGFEFSFSGSIWSIDGGALGGEVNGLPTFINFPTQSPFDLPWENQQCDFGPCTLQSNLIAPNNGTSWYKNTCITSALKTGALNVGIDAIGLIPEGGGVARIIGHGAGYRGVVADQLGHRVINAAGHSAGTVNGLAGLGDTSPEGLLSTGLTVAGFIPGVGQVASIGSILLDTYKTAKGISQCH